ncbi:MAG: carboxypeptidase regulatory-like domain-containing protein, partial [Desulfobacterales bacterium]|nr:carboxypeptidase regulatory-like domain-containing protein [Desulfobacterales bacterium]
MQGKKRFGGDLFRIVLFSLFLVAVSSGALSAAQLEITVSKDGDAPLAGVSTYLFTDTGSYLNQSAVTDAAGQASFSVPDGSYQVRADYLGYQFWSGIVSVTADAATDLTIAHQDVTFTAVQSYPSADPLVDAPVYLFTGAGSYRNVMKRTDAAGQVVFSLPDQSYKVRADWMRQQFWSEVSTWEEKTVTVPTAVSEVAVTGAGQPLAGVKVYAFTGAGSYLNLNATTDAAGTVSFVLPAAEHQFRADYQGSQFFSQPAVLLADQVNAVSVNTGGGTLTVTVAKGPGEPMEGVATYLFTDTGSYLNQSAVTDAAGQASFSVPDGSYQVRADYLGYQFWSGIVSVTADAATDLTIAHQDVTFTAVQSYPAADPLVDAPVYLFTGAGSYRNVMKRTDAAGQVVFSLPDQSYKVRADWLGRQFWSEVSTWQDETVTVPTAVSEVTVTGAGQPLAGVKVYAFTGAGSYLNLNATTDAAGQVSFVLPAAEHQFRADYQGSQYFSQPAALLADQVNAVSIDTVVPAIDFSADPTVIPPGGTSVLSWSAPYAHTCQIDPAIGPVAPVGNQAVSLSETTTYTITASNAAGSSTAQVTVTVAELPTVTFSASPSTIAPGGEADLTWNTTNADSVTIDNGIGTVPLSGTIPVYPAETTIYTIFATGPGGTATATATVTVQPASLSVAMTAVPDTIQAGETAILQWFSEMADSCEISPGIGPVPLSGALPVYPNTTTTYTITALGAAGTAQSTATVTVGPAGLVESQIFPEGEPMEAGFGMAVALSQEWALVGAPYEETAAGSGAGAVYVYYRQSGAWAFYTKLTAFDGAAYDRFGDAVAIEGDVIVVGAPNVDRSCGEQCIDYSTGAAYVYRFVGDQWAIEDKLVAADAYSSWYFGDAVDVSAGSIFVGAPGTDVECGFECEISYAGSVYVFDPAFEGWIQSANLTVPDPVYYAYAGEALDAEENTLIVGAPYTDRSCGIDCDIYAAGAAHVFTNTGSEWIYQAELAPASPTEGELFGMSVGISGDTIAVGAPFMEGDMTGSVYVFERSDGVWNAGGNLAPQDLVPEAGFGYSVAVAGDHLLASAPMDENDQGLVVGSTYLFQKTAGAWNMMEKITAEVPMEWSYFGEQVDLISGTAMVGTYDADTVYFYDFPTKKLALSLEPQVILLGETADLQWTSSGIDTVSIEPGIGTVDPSGSVSVAPEVTTTYMAVGSGPEGQAAAAGTLYVVDPTIAPEAEVSASAETITSGDSVVLSWNATNATQVTIEPGIGGVLPSGHLTLTPEVTTTYLITATGPAGTTAVSITVEVLHVPEITLLTPDTEGRVADACFTIRWTDADADSNASIALFYDIDGSGADGTLIVSGLSEDPDGPSADSFVWTTADLPEASSFYIYAVIEDGTHDPVVAYSPFPVQVSHLTSVEQLIEFSTGGELTGSYFGSPVAADGDTAVVASGDSGPVSVFRRECQNWVLEQTITAEAAQQGEIEEPLLNIMVADYRYGEAHFTGWDRDFFSGEEVPIDLASWWEGISVNQIYFNQPLCGPLLIRSIEFLVDGAWILRSSDVFWEGSSGIFDQMTYSPGQGWLMQNSSGSLRAVGTWAEGFRPSAVRVTFEPVNDLMPNAEGCYTESFPQFGDAIAVAGDLLAVVDSETPNGGIYGRGAVYLFRRGAGGWEKEAKIRPEDAGAIRLTGPIAIGDDMLAVTGTYDELNLYADSVTEAVFIFRFDGSSWVYQNRLESMPPETIEGFGAALAFDNDRLVVGAPYADIADGEGGTNWSGGTAYVFRDNGAYWTLEAELRSQEPRLHENFGASVAIDGDMLAVGDPDYGRYQVSPHGGNGEVFVYKYENGSWNFLHELLPNEVDPYNDFGASLGLAGGNLFVGDPNYDDGAASNNGALYLIKILPDGTLESFRRIAAGDPSSGFGASLSMGGSFALVGAPYAYSGAGAAYVQTFAAVSAQLAAAPAVTTTGDAVLSWTTQNANTVTIDPGIGAVDTNGSLPVTVPATTTFILTAGGLGETATAETTVTVGELPPSVTFAADLSWIRVGDPVELSWTATGADTVAIDPGLGGLNASGTAVVHPTETTTYSLTASGPGGTVSRQEKVLVLPSPAPSAGLSVVPASMTVGEAATLYWNAVNVDSAVLEPGGMAVAIDGSMSVSPESTTTYTILVDGPYGSASANVTLTVYAPSDIDYGLDTSGAAVGATGGDRIGEGVLLTSGNVMEARTDASFASPNRLGFGLDAVYNSRLQRLGAMGYGWTHTFEAALSDNGGTVTIVDGTGRSRYFSGAGGVYYGMYGEKSHVSAELPGFVWQRLDGSRFGFSAEGRLEWMDDAVGNRIALSYDAYGRLETATDLAGTRQIVFHYVGDRLSAIVGPAAEAVPDGIWASYAYDGEDNLSSVTYADGSGFAYSYSYGSHNLTRKENAAGHLLNTWMYDSDDRVTSSYSRNGTGMDWIEYVGDTLVTVTDAYYVERTYTIAEFAGRKRVVSMQGPVPAPYAPGTAVGWEYDGSANLIEVRYANGAVDQYLDHDTHGNPATVVLATGTPEQRNISYTYHPVTNQVLTRTEQSVLGAGSKVTIFDFDDDDDDFENELPTNLVHRIVEEGYTADSFGSATGYFYVTSYDYNAKGQLV